MKMYYITLNTPEEAQKISHALLNEQLAVCTNWFPIACAYRWEGEILEESEVVLVVKTQEGFREAIEKVISEYITYLNCIAELDVHSINKRYLDWLNAEIPVT
ncbi:MAG: divalent-cation tolerance protein CutA [Alphaproteobacteria bacterium]|nr:divalent-cation tolerance protein CutA [Alphaproteobacteria bacterium]